MTVRTRNIADASITSRALAADVFTTVAHVAADAVDSRSIAALAVGTSELSSATFKTGYIPLDITTVRLISGNVVQDTIEAGVPDNNTAPSITRINAGTDRAAVVTWITDGVEEVMFAPFALPPDIDSTAVLSVKLRGIAADTSVIAVSYFEGIGATNAGGNTGALAAGVTTVSVDILASNVGAAGAPVTIGLKPAAHAGAAVTIYAAWIEYTRIGVGT